MNSDSAVDLFAAVAQHHRLSWTLSESAKFGANALKVDGKIFAALTRSSRLLLKLPPARVDALVVAGRAERFASGGRAMNGWIVVSRVDQAEWITLSEEARKFVASQTSSSERNR